MPEVLQWGPPHQAPRPSTFAVMLGLALLAHCGLHWLGGLASVVAVVAQPLTHLVLVALARSALA